MKERGQWLIIFTSGIGKVRVTHTHYKYTSVEIKDLLRHVLAIKRGIVSVKATCEDIGETFYLDNTKGGVQ